jgi:hypothetical protein
MRAEKIGLSPIFGLKALAMAPFIWAMASDACAEVVIGSGATKNMICSGGACAPNATNAVLNVGDLETLLASGSVTVTSTGAGVQANDIAVQAGLGWSSSATLVLAAFRSLSIAAPVSVDGAGGLTLAIDEGSRSGTLAFGSGGNVTFANMSSALVIDGTTYQLVNSVAGLAAAIGANASGAYALATGYDASPDGAYSAAPVSTGFKGSFEGLGNTISNLSVNVAGSGSAGLFAAIQAGATVRDIGIVSPGISGRSDVGALAATNAGTITGSFAQGGTVAGGLAGGLVGVNTATVSKSYSTSVVFGTAAGGLVGDNAGTITLSYATGQALGAHGSGNTCGGLVGINQARGSITLSFAMGGAAGTDGQYDSDYGGLVGENSGKILQSYAEGAASSGPLGEAGGLVGRNTSGSSIAQSYSTGAISGGGGSYLGGSIGYDLSAKGDNSATYWDTSTSGIANTNQGAGNIANDPGLTGLTTAILQSGLPKGFGKNNWAENAQVNGGLPYLLANPPPG